MIRSRFLFAAILILQCAAHSQKNTPPGATKINYVARIPASVTKYRPKSAITRFYGLTEIQGQKLAFHFYDVGPAQTIYSRLKQNGLLDVFSVRRRRNTTFYERIHTIVLTRDLWPWPKQKTVCQMLNCWLDPDQKTRPILMLRVLEEGNGSRQTDALLTFAKGLKNPPSVNYFGWVYPVEGLWSENTRYDFKDKNGYIAPCTISDTVGQDTLTVYGWNGQTFKRNRTARGLGY